MYTGNQDCCSHAYSGLPAIVYEPSVSSTRKWCCAYYEIQPVFLHPLHIKLWFGRRPTYVISMYIIEIRYVYCRPSRTMNRSCPYGLIPPRTDQLSLAHAAAVCSVCVNSIQIRLLRINQQGLCVSGFCFWLSLAPGYRRVLRCTLGVFA